jgi:hypothetical protein
MNPFERYEIHHLSPSSLALYRAAPALWCLRYLFGVRDEGGPFAWRGRAIESAVDAIVFDGVGDDEAIEQAKQVFETEARGEITPEIDRERRVLSAMVVQAGAVFRRLGKPLSRQKKVQIWLPGVEVPVIGYSDYEYSRFVLDLKTPGSRDPRATSSRSGPPSRNYRRRIRRY